MTVAVDLRTRKVIGQVIDETPDLTLQRDPSAQRLYLLLTKDGYTTVPATSVRVEKVD